MLPMAFEFTSPGPIIFELGPLAIRWYGLLIATAVLLGLSLARTLGKTRHLNPELFDDLAIWLLLGAIPGARLYYVAFQWSTYANSPADIFAIWKGGIAIHGAIIGGSIAALLFAKWRQVSFWQLTDVIAPSVILGQAIGRWGNFFNSEAFGRPTDFPWKLYIPLERRPLGYEQFEYFHPTFLYESLWNLMGLSVLLFLFFYVRDGAGKSQLKVGSLSLVYLVVYSAGRLWIEGLRTDSLMLGTLRIAQGVSLGGIVLGIAGLIWLYVLKKSLPDVIE